MQLDVLCSNLYIKKKKKKKKKKKSNAKLSQTTTGCPLGSTVWHLYTHTQSMNARVYASCCLLLSDLKKMESSSSARILLGITSVALEEDSSEVAEMR
jgi:hypothetical protein